MKQLGCADAKTLIRLFDRGTGKEYINNLQGNINSVPAIIFRTENFAYIKARDGKGIDTIALLVDLKKNYIKKGLTIRQTTTENIITLAFYE